jgi:uncharacterized protein YbaP (TraB family)
MRLIGAKPVLILLCWLVASAAPAVQAPVFEVRLDGALEGYLVGTMHSDDPRVMATLSTLDPLLDDVDTLVVELIPDALASAAFFTATLLPDDRSLSGVIGDARFRRLAAVAADRGIPAALLQRMKPWAAAVTVGTPQPESGQVLDTALYLAARDRDRKIVALETVPEQVAVFDGLPEDLQLEMVDAVIKDAPQLPMQFQALIDAYLVGDLETIAEVARAEYDGVSPRLQAWFDRELLERRNDRMLDRLEELLPESGAVLVAVGALHLAGPNGLVDGLRGLGYAVEPLRRPWRSGRPAHGGP